MNMNEALDVFECISNLDNEHLLGYYCKHYLRIREAAKIGAESIRQIQRINKLLECWEVCDATAKD